MVKEEGLWVAVAEAEAGGRTFCWVCRGLTPGSRPLSRHSGPLLLQPQPPSAWSMACVWTMLLLLLLLLLLMKVVFGRHRRGQYDRRLRYRAARL